MCKLTGFIPSLPGGHKKRCRLSWLTNSALVYESKCGVLANKYSGVHHVTINSGDLTPYLTYALSKSHLSSQDGLRGRARVSCGTGPQVAAARLAAASTLCPARRSRSGVLHPGSRQPPARHHLAGNLHTRKNRVKK